jgi:hypothetical protein
MTLVRVHLSGVATISLRNEPSSKVSSGCVAQPAPLAGVTEQHLQHREGDQFSVGDLGLEPDLGTLREPLRVGLEQVIHLYVQCRDEVVEGGVHEAFSKVDDA